MEDLVKQLLSLAKGFWKYRWHGALIAWVIAISGWIVVFNLPNNYQASARVYVDTDTVLKPLLAGMTTIPNVEQQVGIMSRTLLSRPNMERVMRMVDLDIKANNASAHEKLIDELMAKIKIAGTSQNNIYTITYNDEKPKLVKDVVQSLLTIFVEGSLGNKKQDSEKAIQFIDEQIKNYEEKLSKAENALKEFKLKNIGLLPRQGSDYGTKLMETSENLNQAKLELLEAEQARDAIKKQISGGGTPTPGKSDLNSATISNPEIDARIQALNKNLDALRLQFTEQHPDITATKRLIAQLEARKVEEAKIRNAEGDPGLNYSPMMQQLKVSLAAAEAKVAAMKARVDEYTMRVNHLKQISMAGPEVETELAQLNRDYMINKENYEKLVARRESAKLTGDLSATSEMMSFKVIDPPTMPVTPIGPKRPLLYSLVFLGAVLAGIASAILLSTVRPTFLSQYSLREATGLPILGSVSMIWTEAEKRRRKRNVLALGAAGAVLFCAYGVILVGSLLSA
jgi:polysaccharide chain length determinant protein (PEP-CTERM system associated)